MQKTTYEYVRKKILITMSANRQLAITFAFHTKLVHVDMDAVDF